MSSAFIFVITMVFLVGLPLNHGIPAPPAITQWPEECEGKTYCTTKPKNYPEEIFEALLKGAALEIEQNGGMENRSSDENLEDVASCHPYRQMDPVYLIKDENEKIRFVAQTETFKIRVQIEECRKPGRTLIAKDLDAYLLEIDRVDCFETRVPMQFLVLSINGTTLESVAPKDGIPSSCSAKLMRDE